MRPLVRHAVAPQSAGPSEPWSTSLADPRRGTIRLTGRLHQGRQGPLVILVHGLGGHIESPYMIRASRALSREGLPHLRIHLRGADRGGDDFYHAGLIEDLDATLASPEVQAHQEVILWGFSLGGHVALRFAAERGDARLRSVVAVCPPLDLDAGARAIDAWPRRPFLRYVLAGLVDIYARAAARGGGPVSIERARAIRSIRTWDDEIIAPRFGFRDAADYYEKMSAGPLLRRISVPTLLVSGNADPMIPLGTVAPSLKDASRSVEVRVVPGGHVGFSRRLNLGQRAAPGLDAQVLAWLTRRGG